MPVIATYIPCHKSSVAIGCSFYRMDDLDIQVDVIVEKTLIQPLASILLYHVAESKIIK
jgi:hypothetical protein